MTTASSQSLPFDASGRPAPPRRATVPQLRELFDRVPPHDEAAEMSLLGSMIRDHTVIGDVLEFIKSGDAFYKPGHGAIFDELVTLYDHNNASDIVQLHSRLKDLGILDELGGDEYLVTLGNSTPSTANAVHFAAIVRQKARIRDLLQAAGQILYEGFHAGELPEIDGDSQVLLDRAESMIFKIAETAETTQEETLKEILDRTMVDLERRAEEGSRFATGVPTGFMDLDEKMLGLQPGEMIIIAGRPSMGKTAFALNISQRMATRGYPVGLFSLEMTREQVAQRMLSAEAGVDAQRMRRSQLSEDDFRSLFSACSRLTEAPMYVDDTPGLSVLALRTKARRMKARHDVQAIIIDYIQLMTASSRESRQQEVSEISRGIKALARELRVPVICLSQLNRASENRESHRPRMSDLRESGSLEQDADVVMLLHREDYYHQGDSEYDQTNLAQIILAKQRNGPTGTIELKWDGMTTSFRNYSAADASAGASGYASHASPSGFPAPTPPDPHPPAAQHSAEGDEFDGIPV